MVKKRKVPQRICLGCREYKEKRALVRIVRTPGEEVLLDSTGKKPGRGAYVCSNEQCLEKAIKGKSLQKNLRCPIPETLLQELKEHLDK